MNVNNPHNIIEELDKKLDNLKLDQENILIQIEKAIGVCSLALIDLREYVISNGFKNKENEICFFKCIKPKVYSLFLYYSKLFTLESKRPLGTINSQKKYLMQELDLLEYFFIENSGFYNYYRLKQSHMDEKYFLRDSDNFPQNFNDLHFIIDKEFSTSYDQTLATIIAHEKLIDYIKSEILELELLKEKGESISNLRNYMSDLKWTESKSSLVELIYALHSSGAINMGQLDIKELAKTFQEIFNIELGDYYHTFIEVRNRKNERTKFLNNLIQSLLKRMDDADK